VIILKTAIKEKEIKAIQTVEYVQFDDTFTLYKITTKIGEQTSYRCGLCLNTEVEALLTTPETFKSEVSNYSLWRREAIEMFRTNLRAFQNSYETICVKIGDIFNNIETINDFSEYVILYYYSYDEQLFEYGKEIPLPKSIYFGYISENMTNEYHDLEKCLEILEQRDDVEIYTSRHYNKKIQDVPYYNQNEENNRRFIEFIWKPTKVDWEKIYPVCYKKYNHDRYEYIKKNIFKLPFLN
jgi:hypothetical protein